MIIGVTRNVELTLTDGCWWPFMVENNKLGSKFGHMRGVAQRQNGNRSAHNSTCQKTAHISGLDAEIRRSGRGSVSQFAQRLLSQWLPSSCYSAALSTFFIISFRRWWRSRSPNLPSRRIDSTPRTLRAFIAFCLWGSKNGFVWIWAKPFTKMNLSRCLLVFTRPSGN